MHIVQLFSSYSSPISSYCSCLVCFPLLKEAAEVSRSYTETLLLSNQTTVNRQTITIKGQESFFKYSLDRNRAFIYPQLVSLWSIA